MHQAYCKTCGRGIADENIGRFRYVFQEESQDFCSERCRTDFVKDPEKYLREDEEEE